MTTGRVMQQRRLRAALRQLREQAGDTQKSVAEALEWSTSKVIRIETGAVHVSSSDVRALLHYYGVRDDLYTRQLLAMTKSRGDAWWDAYQPYYKQQFLDFLDYENSAVRIRQFMGFVVPGLLQTEAYARTLLETYFDDRERIERGVEVRMRRQQILAVEKEREAWFLIDEAALHRWIGGPDLVREQLLHIRKIAKQPNISVRVIPFTAGMHPGLRGSFTIFEFPEADEELVVNVEDPHRDVLIRDDAAATSQFVETYYALEDIAIGDAELGPFIDSLLGDLDRRR